MTLYQLFFLFVCLASFSESVKPLKPRWEPLPTCEECITPDLIVAPGVGFDLTPSYGTAAIRFHDGSVVDIGKFDGSESYKSLMRRLSEESSRPPSHFNSIWDELKYLAQRAKRQINKRRGLPATEDVGILGSLLMRLRVACEEQLGQRVEAAVAAMPILPGMTREDHEDAMYFAGLTTLGSYNYFGSVSEVSAVFAGMGYGLCSNPREIDVCEDEEAAMPLRYVLAVGLTDSLLSATYTTLRHAHSSFEAKTILNFDLGLEALQNHHYDASTYWNRVRTSISNVAALASEPIDTLLLHGEGGMKGELLDVIHEILGGNVQSPLNSPTLQLSASLDPLYIAARGAAEFAKRFQETPWGCKEPEWCFEDVMLVDQESKGRGYEGSKELR